MIETLLATVLSSALFLSSLPSSPSATPQLVVTRVLPEGNFVVHSVKKGETLTSIAHFYYDDEAYWTNLWNYNTSLKDPDVLQEDSLIKVAVNKHEKPAELIEELQNKYWEKEQEAQIAYYKLTVAIITPPNSTPAASYPQSSYDEVYKQAGEKYGVPWQILYGLHITETGGRNGAISNSSGSGAQGPMQFMPGTWRAYGVDGDGDGVADINNAVDAIHGAANYLIKHGSLDNGLRAYGGNMSGTLRLAKERGYSLGETP